MRKEVMGTRVEQAWRKASIASKSAMNCALTEDLPQVNGTRLNHHALQQCSVARLWMQAAHKRPTTSLYSISSDITLSCFGMQPHSDVMCCSWHAAQMKSP